MFLVLLILAFFILGPELHPSIFPNDVAGAGEGRTGEGGLLGQWAGLKGQPLGQNTRQGGHLLGLLSPEVGGQAPQEVLLPILQLQGLPTLDVADERAFLPDLHLI